ncbi:hypothetical protein C5167_050491 [Papaver somniferum]|uniref:Uncharacterized protein n=1 Tax=Papaver somniferum TaxID=3469 RepID=A0A4Y7KS79_PAPSO|nr:hypothetical protein C5167_050491 [Papaver somniferum]
MVTLVMGGGGRGATHIATAKGSEICVVVLLDNGTDPHNRAEVAVVVGGGDDGGGGRRWRRWSVAVVEGGVGGGGGQRWWRWCSVVLGGGGGRRR